MTRLWAAAAGALVAVGPVARAQTTIRGTVVAAIGRRPIAAATVTLRRSGTTSSTDQLGRFRLRQSRTPDTLVVAAIGWRPDSLAVPAARADPVEIQLHPAAVVMSDLITVAPAERSVDLSGHGQWRMPLAAARTVPPAVETDVFRALALIPAVSFTSPLSARPLIRGYDAEEVATRIDGFEVLNLFHLGRFFSSFPADAAAQVTVTAPPYSDGRGGPIAGLIDVGGLTGPAGGLHGSAGTSFGSLAGSAGGGTERLRLFGSGRLLHLELLGLVPGVDVPYRFEDFYASAVVGRPDRPRGRVTLFATEDRAGRSAESRLDWDNLLLGTRWRVVDRGRATLEVSAAGARFREDGAGVPSIHHRPADFANRFGRLTGTAELRVDLDHATIAAGLEVGSRSVESRIGPTPALGPPDSSAELARFAGPETAIHAGLTRRLGPITVETGLRADCAGSGCLLEPRVLARWRFARHAWTSAGLGRAARTFHQIADPRSEPDLDFLDFWLPAGGAIPAARVDHASLDLDVEVKSLRGRLSIFGSRGTGIGELRPDTDERSEGGAVARFGRSRTRGLEAQAAYRGSPGRPSALAVSYVYSTSERNWDGRWIRWAQDRRHQFRLFGQTSARGVTLFGALDAATGMPLTPATHQFESAVPGLPPLGSEEPRTIFGPENSATTSGTLRVDVGLSYAFGGPGSSRLTLGASVINLFAGPVAPIAAEGEGAGAVDQLGRPVPYRRLFDLPAIPTLTLRIEF